MEAALGDVRGSGALWRSLQLTSVFSDLLPISYRNVHLRLVVGENLGNGMVVCLADGLGDGEEASSVGRIWQVERASPKRNGTVGRDFPATVKHFVGCRT